VNLSAILKKEKTNRLYENISDTFRGIPREPAEKKSPRRLCLLPKKGSEKERVLLRAGGEEARAGSVRREGGDLAGESVAGGLCPRRELGEKGGRFQDRSVSLRVPHLEKKKKFQRGGDDTIRGGICETEQF